MLPFSEDGPGYHTHIGLKIHLHKMYCAAVRFYCHMYGSQPVYPQSSPPVISPPEVSIYHGCRAYPQYKRPLQLLQHYHIYIYVYAHLSFL